MSSLAISERSVPYDESTGEPALFGHSPWIWCANFHERLYESIMETFIPWPALGLCVWHASPAIKAQGICPASAPFGTSSYLSQMRWPIS